MALRKSQKIRSEAKYDFGKWLIAHDIAAEVSTELGIMVFPFPIKSNHVQDIPSSPRSQLFFVQCSHNFPIWTARKINIHRNQPPEPPPPAFTVFSDPHHQTQRLGAIRPTGHGDITAMIHHGTVQRSLYGLCIDLSTWWFQVTGFEDDFEKMKNDESRTT